MRNWKIIENKVCIDEEEIEEIENYVKKENGKIIWGCLETFVESGDKEVSMIFYLRKDGIFALPLKDV